MSSVIMEHSDIGRMLKIGVVGGESDIGMLLSVNPTSFTIVRSGDYDVKTFFYEDLEFVDKGDFINLVFRAV